MKPPPRGDALARQVAGLAPTETILLAIRPSPWIIITERWRMLLVLAIIVVLLSSAQLSTLWPNRVAALIVGLTILWLLIAAWDWSVRIHLITRTRVIAAAGILKRVIAEAPLSRVQQITVIKTASERVVGVGTVIVETAGSGLGVVEIFGVPRPDRIARIVRAAAARSDASRRDPLTGAARVSVGKPKHHQGVLVLGLAGGIGAGKSAVAAELARLGCVVVDSDRESRAALDRPEVREQLVKWWGGDLLDEAGAIDRRKIAEIVFKDPEQRRRLEGLVHPIVRQSRAEIVKRAAGTGARVVIVDAPLLFEAGVDKECDAVIFVDAPLEVRAERVQRTRGWSLEELQRREAAQLAVDEKRRRSGYLVLNDSSSERLGRLVRQTLERAKADFGLPAA